MKYFAFFAFYELYVIYSRYPISCKIISFNHLLGVWQFSINNADCFLEFFFNLNFLNIFEKD